MFITGTLSRGGLFTLPRKACISCIPFNGISTGQNYGASSKKSDWFGESKSKTVKVKSMQKVNKFDLKSDKTDETGNGAGAEKEVQIPQNLLSAVKSVAENLGGDTKLTESELVQKLKVQNSAKINLSEIFVGMKIDRTQKPTQESSIPQMSEMGGGGRAQRVRKILEEDQNRRSDSNPRWSRDTRDTREHDGGDNNYKRDREHRPFRPREHQSQAISSGEYIKIDIFGQPPLKIFSKIPKTDERKPENVPSLKVWDSLYAKEMKLAVTHPPKNGFEEMILWTEQGKMWKFPIDNEQGLEEEAKSSFHEHLFLEPSINTWCPKKGPIRHFMELVCVGLGKNPHISVKEKHVYLEWYHQYFLKKSEILKEVGAGEVT